MLPLFDAAPTVVEFFVSGVPAPQGSKRHVGRGRLVESSKKLEPWRAAVKAAAEEAMASRAAMPGAARAVLEFVLVRPKSTPKRSTPPAVKYPDVDKLARAVFDGIGGVIVGNDSQIVDVHAVKRLAEIGEGTGVSIRIEELP